MTPRAQDSSSDDKEDKKDTDRAAIRAAQNRKAQRLYRQRKEARVRELEATVAKIVGGSESAPTPREAALLERIRQLEEENSILRTNQHHYTTPTYHPYAYPYYPAYHWQYYPHPPAPVNHFTALPYQLPTHEPDFVKPIENEYLAHSTSMEHDLLLIPSLKPHSESVIRLCQTFVNVIQAIESFYGADHVVRGTIATLWLDWLLQRHHLLSKCTAADERLKALTIISNYLFNEHREKMSIELSPRQGQSEPEEHLHSQLANEFCSLPSMHNYPGLASQIFRERQELLSNFKKLSAVEIRERRIVLASLQIQALLMCSPCDRIEMERITDCTQIESGDVALLVNTLDQLDDSSAENSQDTKESERAAIRAEQNRRAQRLYRLRKEARVRELETIVAERTTTTPTPRELELLERIKHLEDENTMLRANQHTYPSYGYHPYTYPYYQNPYWNFYPQSGPAPVYPSVSLPTPYYYNRDTTYPHSKSNTLETTLLGLQSLRSHSELVNEFCGTLTHFFNQTSLGQTDGPTPANEIMVADDLVSEGEAKYNQPQLNSETTINDSDVQLENEYKQLSSLQNDMGLVRTFFHATKVYLSLNDAGTLILSR
ncbi:hypothetical protein BCR33DRAFT_825446 [Rhizoclosmatium globosum]|uniref:BZIP domain-containing protein n=1 Tax=Rhizoclosmatium globosum TaxID=329046 RepID=A0A1Y2C3F6_9FUNG|nr:hypothetical protein BCR33DRAFT_825446 [Rhizoclosmatium globosum]|eukprot:ORY41558.1 hypothetical protein BCR33DRAFT_825446 [Rhizoclosmatium globosum]